MKTTTTAAEIKHSFRMPTVYTILFAIIVLVASLTWIVPAGKYDSIIDGSDQVLPAEQVLNYAGSERLLPVPGTYRQLPARPQGVSAVMMAPIRGFAKAIDIALFVLIIGGFLAVTMSTGAISSTMTAIVRRFRGREYMMIPVLIAVFALCGSTWGMCEETVAFWAVILPVLVAAGYDRMVAAGVILLGSGVGVLASTTNPFCVGIASGFAGLSIGDGIVLRVIHLLLLIVLTSWFVMRYASKVKAHRTASSLKKGGEPRLIGRTIFNIFGGMNSKLHVLSDGAGRPIWLHLSESHRSDFKGEMCCFLSCRRRKC